MFKFLKEYVKSMRLYYSFVTGIAGWIGVAYYDYISGVSISAINNVFSFPVKKIVILVLAFLSWGINQVINDYLGIPEDRINAPERPMVSGDLDPRNALIVSIILIFISSLITLFYLQPIAIVFLFAGVLLNVLYETAKGYGILGNIVFGIMISMASLYGFYASGPVNTEGVLKQFMPILMFLWIINGLMTFYTYFKDYKGDKKTGKKTLVVLFGLRKSRVIALIAAFFPIFLFLLFKLTNTFSISINREFIILGSLVVILQIWTGMRFYLNPVGKSTYTSLGVNFKACVCGEAALIALYNPNQAVWLFIISYCAVTILFSLYKNAKA